MIKNSGSFSTLWLRKIISIVSLHSETGCSSPIVGPVAQLVEAHGLGPCQSRFESGRGHLGTPGKILIAKQSATLVAMPRSR